MKLRLERFAPPPCFSQSWIRKEEKIGLTAIWVRVSAKWAKRDTAVRRCPFLIRFSECPPGKQKGYEERVIKVGIAATRRKRRGSPVAASKCELL